MNRFLLALLALLIVAGCKPAQQAEIPPPATLDPAATAHFCGMAVGEHPGPKGQVWLDDQKQPLWFSSVHDTIAFTLLPEEPKNIQAIYVSDMGKAPPGGGTPEDAWVEARQAVFVIESRIAGGMGGNEEVPFADRAAALAFVNQNGGRVVAFAEIPKDGILGTPVGIRSDKRGR
ncbi:nitrous oxide reductase accessory protein NosL [Telmatospirillum sp.]|uniref:nitrous oxide reductase accessory protein NosL n=1 Tax=Telmatospirillum sp. TaxID=2079197 RepID=UPI00284AAF5D|nr:nitrous oxide reductase accessory protein NosL [Telmatospirillum sp.]MDR3439376.1 nitrous oxide reductase accessory protein NosL [Telmatospirillum sp.]